MSRIYVATSWRNEAQPEIVKDLRAHGHEVYDFRNPFRLRSASAATLQGGFHWSNIDPAWKDWTPERYRDALLNSELAAHGFTSDFRAMRWCDTCLLVLPCGRSAHLELGWCAGAGKRTIILLEKAEPELMALIADDICISMQEVHHSLSKGATKP